MAEQQTGAFLYMQKTPGSIPHLSSPTYQITGDAKDLHLRPGHLLPVRVDDVDFDRPEG